MNKNEYWENYKRMVYKSAHQVSKKMRVDFEEAKSQAMLYFTMVLNSYDNTRGSFSTILHLKLKSLYKYFSAKKNNLNTIGEAIYFIDSDFHQKFVNILDFYDSSCTELSKEAQQMLSIIFEWDGNRKPSFNSIKSVCMRLYCWSLNECKKTWDELKIWWLSYEI